MMGNDGYENLADEKQIERKMEKSLKLLPSPGTLIY